MNDQTETRICRECKIEKPISSFGRQASRPDGINRLCKQCKNRYNKTKEEAKIWFDNHIESHMLTMARQRSRKKGLECTISISDITIPQSCPLLGIPLFRGNRSNFDNAPTLDRIDSTKGYVPGNIWVISKRANTMKSDASLEELIKLVENFKTYLEQREIPR